MSQLTKLVSCRDSQAYVGGRKSAADFQRVSVLLRRESLRPLTTWVA